MPEVYLDDSLFLNVKEEDTPIHIVRKYGNIYPNVYDLLDSMAEKFHTEYSDTFPSWCYMPSSIAAQLMRDTSGYKKEYSDICAGLVTCAMWRKHKILYQFHPDLMELLCNQADDISDTDRIPVNIILNNMPYPVIYVHCKSIDNGCNGFFSWIDLIQQRPVLRFGFTPLSNDAIVFSSLMLIEDGTVSDCINATAIHSGGGKPAQTAEEIRPFLRALQILLYILSANSDQVENSYSKAIHRESMKIKDKFREIKQVDVGIHVSAAMRQATTGSAVSTELGSPKKSHMRRGHWHHYWVGTNLERHLILKWLAPMAIKCQSSEDIPITITPVKKLNKNA